MLLLAFMVLGIAGMVGGSVAMMRNIRQARLRPSKRKVLVVIAVFGIGVALALASFRVVYPYGERTKVVGFPLPAASWEKHGDHWLDFVGPLTLPFSWANAWFAFVLSHLVFRALQRKTGQPVAPDDPAAGTSV